VTGANGFVATEIIKQLLESEYKVRGTVRTLKSEDKYKHLWQFKNADTNLELIEANLLQECHWPK
jgi:os09g0493500 protein